MDYKKNDEVIVSIHDLGKDGEGIGHLDGYALFIKEALPGETVRAKIMKLKKSYGFARLLEIVEPSPARVQPLCPVARQCGGCTLQHLNYEAQLTFKQKKVQDSLERIGGINLSQVQIEPIMGMEEPWYYRNKAQFPIRTDKDGDPVIGFYAERTHSVIPVTDCAIQDKAMRTILNRVQTVMEDENIPAYDEVAHIGLLRHIFLRRADATGEIMICLIINGSFDDFKEKYGAFFTAALSKITGVVSILVNCNRERTNVIMGAHTQLLWGKEYIEDKIGGVRYEISAHSFYQINPKQTQRLYETALEYASLQGGETVWDLYCGIGTISLFLASSVGPDGHVYGVEIVPEAVQDAKRNAALNGITNVEFFCGAAEEIVGSSAVAAVTGRKPQNPDVVVIDPPRKGCDEALLEAIGEMLPERIVYVSCDPATLARDVKTLAGKGYALRRMRAYDMFPQGGHVECVVKLCRVEK